MQLVKQYKLGTYLGQNMKAQSERLLEVTTNLKSAIILAEVPHDEEMAKGIVEDMLSMADGIKACFSALYKDLEQCAGVFAPPKAVGGFVFNLNNEKIGEIKPSLEGKQITGTLGMGTESGDIRVVLKTQQLEEKKETAAGVSLKEFAQTTPYTAKQLLDYMYNLRCKGISVPQQIGRRGKSPLYNAKELKAIADGWSINPALSKPRKKTKETGRISSHTPNTTTTVKKPENKVPMASIGDFVDQFELDLWRGNKLRQFLDQAWLDKAITQREERTHGPNRYFVYPVDQLQVAANRWAHTFLGNVNSLKRKR